MHIKRTFDLLDHCVKTKARDDAFAGKKNREWVPYTTQEFYDYSHWFALGLLERGITKGEHIATITNNCPEWNFIDMGIAMTGAIHVPIYPTISEEDYQYIIKHADIKLIIVSNQKLYNKLKPVAEALGNVEILSINPLDEIDDWKSIIQLGKNASDANKQLLETRKDEIDEDEVVTMIYTSGTTGTPKGVMLSHMNLISNFTAQAEYHDVGYGHRAISFLPLCHVYERCLNYHFIFKGIGIYYVETLAGIMPAIKEVKPHIFNTVPRLLERIYDGIISKGKSLSGFKKTLFFWAVRLGHRFDYGKKFGPWFHLKRMIADKLIYSKWRDAMGGNIQVIVSGGASLQGRILSVFGIAKIMTLEGYGLTETSPVIAVSHPKKRLIRVGTVGPVLKGVEVKIAEDGEILCRGPLVMKGYYKEPELTAQAIDKDGWFHTGDVGEFVEDIYLKITDRKKEIFKLSGGKYIAPQMIENKLKESLLIEQTIVVGEGQKHASALIIPNMDYLHDWCAKENIHFSNNEELVQLSEVYTLITKEVAEVNKTLGQVEQLSRFKLVADSWTPDSGELSPTLKLKRQFIHKKYNNLINQIYGITKEEESSSRLSQNFKDIKKQFKM